MRLLPFAELLSRSRHSPPVEDHVGRELARNQRLGPGRPSEEEQAPQICSVEDLTAVVHNAGT